MTHTLPNFYDTDLAYIHDVGFGSYALGCSPGILEVLQKAGIVDGLIVDLGCGSGICAEHLTEAGYSVVGVDLSPAMIALARQRAPSGELRVESIWSYYIPRCRAVTALGEVLCCRSAPQRASALSRSTRPVQGPRFRAPTRPSMRGRERYR
ncbi:MAG: class I SAM-dependent methyltransferase [Pirellulales bacterium]